MNVPHPNPQPTILGIDIGGANLKYATEDGRSFERSFALWTRHRELSEQLTTDIGRFDGIRKLAVTMTGELADCFAGRADGVRQIVSSVANCVSATSAETAFFYGTDGRFHDAESATANWENVAASNWHALARCVGMRLAKNALLVDIGSTTTDVIAICDGEVMTSAATDFQRLSGQSLVYVGCRRTPVCALVSELQIRGKHVPVMNEVFSTIDDARLLLGLQQEDCNDLETADSQPRDRVHAKTRVARMIGLDSDQISNAESVELAQQIHSAAVAKIQSAVQRWWSCLNQSATQTPVVVLSGHGQDLISPPENVAVMDLRNELSGSLSRGAPSWAVAVLARLEMEVGPVL
ncbi:hydantoinase/oxoprolinase family protein [Aporhodopirellula aestuarii]|uniref:Tetrahydromethanopterin-linked C1 transfer pathway n=1 Tax=Aporhodopirellula aestuarii TaxID=2950107 RepID=A0ABT0UDD8_9BACT|nr:hydantoinase/oxoprolinase family protein [Aporhodopirellula aestuarii]MCM2374393.1 tetrahydromethanopterin-linked C1 transfer pathway [Aporhodopirellula aestuarii]